jgi:hypothetical protein
MPSYNDNRYWDEDDMFMDDMNPVYQFCDVEDWMIEEDYDNSDYEKDIERLASNYLID